MSKGLPLPLTKRKHPSKRPIKNQPVDLPPTEQFSVSVLPIRRLILQVFLYAGFQDAESNQSHLICSFVLPSRALSCRQAMEWRHWRGMLAVRAGGQCMGKS
ncbi:hypothetical protein ONS95_002111 [Cadophora gregata]|uniref:uncharacterized protein n=1 Tax=Cadophora gregata TaxID=51156 RepID=UPI0026DA748E|nr:uncharacterized protein ONS95_002111 [Cadophora gregata]KAK0109414.1 hypothetical protein ONS95_002111 [Cadophora gregata]